MFALDLHEIITLMHTMPVEFMGVLAFLFCAICIITMVKMFGEIGLTVYISVALLVANIQVLKAGQYALFAEPVVLGTVIFASTFLAIDMLVEFYGTHAARRAVALGFISCVMIMGMMLIALGVKPLVLDENSAYAHFNAAHDAMMTLFTPIPAIFAASLFAYASSQYIDIWLYQTIRRFTNNKALWLRAGLANTLSSFIDNVIFSTLAWVVFAAKPVDWHTLFWVYIIGTYAIRLLMGVMFMPILYIVLVMELCYYPHRKIIK